MGCSSDVLVYRSVDARYSPTNLVEHEEIDTEEGYFY